jgi:DNA polymerase III sliding clamp (beta) subunit (PCNA family)
MIVKFDNNRLTFEASSNNIGEGNDYIDIEYKENRIDISFNPTFWRIRSTWMLTR